MIMICTTLLKIIIIVMMILKQAVVTSLWCEVSGDTSVFGDEKCSTPPDSSVGESIKMWAWVIYLCTDFQCLKKDGCVTKTNTKIYSNVPKNTQIHTRYIQDMYKIPGSDKAAAAWPGREPRAPVRYSVSILHTFVCIWIYSSIFLNDVTVFFYWKSLQS